MVNQKREKEKEKKKDIPGSFSTFYKFSLFEKKGRGGGSISWFVENQSWHRVLIGM